jgi:hypothetical protein
MGSLGAHAWGQVAFCQTDGTPDMNEPTRRKWEDAALFIVAIFALVVIFTI